jgi:hypothetical protein
MIDMRNVCIILLRNPKGEDHFEDVRTDGKVRLKRHLKKHDERVGEGLPSEWIPYFISSKDINSCSYAAYVGSLY